MKTILVTGAAGYIGRHVVKTALDMGHRVIAADFAFKGVDERAEFCDVPLFSGDKNIYKALGSPDVCIHLAWRDGFRHNASSHMKDLSSHVVFCNNMAAGGLPQCGFTFNSFQFRSLIKHIHNYAPERLSRTKAGKERKAKRAQGAHGTSENSPRPGYTERGAGREFAGILTTSFFTLPLEALRQGMWASPGVISANMPGVR